MITLRKITDPAPSTTPVNMIKNTTGLPAHAAAQLHPWETALLSATTTPGEDTLQSRRLNASARRQRPWYPLVGHRDGLRANDLVTLASALFVLALEGGTAHGPWPVPGTTDANGDVVPVRM